MAVSVSRRLPHNDRMEDGHSCPSPEAAQDKWRSVGAVEESDRTMDILVRRGLPLRSWQAEKSRTRMSKVLLKRRVPWPSGLILAGAPQHLLRLPPCPEFPVWRVARGGTGQVSGCQSDPPTAAQSIAAGRPALPHTHFHAGRRCLSAGWANSKLGRPVQKV